MNGKLLSLLGLARRAGRVALGSDAAAEALKKGEARLLLLAGDLSPRSAGHAEDAARQAGVRCVRMAETMDEVGMALGRRTGVVAVKDAGFAKKLAALHEQSLQTNGRES